MDTHSDPLFHFNLFPATAFVAAASTSPSNSRRKRTKLIKTSDPDLLAPSSSGAAIAKPKYGKKPDPSAPKITRPCSECGKKFWSWKALFGHMRCHPERQWRGINPPPNFRRSSCPTESKTTMTTEEDYEIAACLIMLANGPNAIDRTEAVTETDDCREIRESETAAAEALGRFMEVSSSKKVFGSHQALGEPKNVKGCDGGEAQSHQDQQPYSVGKEEGCGYYLDLNLPPPMEEDIEESSSSYSSSQLVLDLRLGLN